MSKSLLLKASDLPSKDRKFILSNHAFLHPDDFATLFPGRKPEELSAHVLVKEYVYAAEPHKGVTKDTIGLSTGQRIQTSLSLSDKIEVKEFSQKQVISAVKLEVDWQVKSQAPADPLDSKAVQSAFKEQLNKHYLTDGQKILFDYKGLTLVAKVSDIEVVGLDEIALGSKTASQLSYERRGLFVPNSIVLLKSETVQLHGGDDMYNPPFRNFPEKIEELGIGGLDKEFCDLYRRVFLPRLFPPSALEAMGIKPIRGVLLYGPPGCGKTLMARQIGKLLVGKEPAVINGPELLNKYVGESEQNVRNLFAEAEKEYKLKGDSSRLHVIIFDEIDALFKKRGSNNDGTGVGDNMVNQILTKLDGVKSLNNILIIGMTNRIDLLDEALTRAGRLEVLLEVGLPDEKGRLQILKIHTSKLTTNNFLNEDVSIERLAKLTKNYTGAEIEGIIKSASSFAMNRVVDITDVKKIDPKNINVGINDFYHAMQEVKPAFGVDTYDLESVAVNGITNYGRSFESLIEEANLWISQAKSSDVTPLISILFEGKIGCGKSSIVSTLALKSGFPFVKVINAEKLIGQNEIGKIGIIQKIFLDAHKSPESIIVLDDIERILEYSPIGHQYSNGILQALLVLLRKAPVKGKKVLILCTTSSGSILQSMGLMSIFDAVLSIPNIVSAEEIKKVLAPMNAFDEHELENILPSFRGKSIPVKKLITIGEAVKKTPDLEMKIRRLTQMIAQIQ